MEIGEEIIIKGKIIDFDANPHGAAIKVEVMGFVDGRETLSPLQQPVRFWIHRLDQAEVIVK